MKPDNASVWFLDVGQGHATVACSGGTGLLIDCPSNGVEAVARAVAADAQGGLAAVVITHRDLDHCAGIPEVLGMIPVEALYMNAGYAIPPKGPAGSRVRTVLESIFDRMDERGIEPSQIVTGMSGEVGDISWTAMWPTYGQVLRSSITDATNPTSVVLMLEVAGSKFLLAADAGPKEVAHLLAAGYDLRANALQVPHHGASLPNLPELLAAVQPEFSIISVSRAAPKHPSLTTLETLRDAACHLFCTEVNRHCEPGNTQAHCAGDLRFAVTTNGPLPTPAVAEHLQRVHSFESPRCVPQGRRIVRKTPVQPGEESVRT